MRDVCARRAWVACLLWAVAGCGGAAQAGATGVGGAETAGGELPEWMTSDDSSVAERMRRIAAAMRDGGLELGSIGGRGFLTQGEHRIEALDLPAHTCTTIVAIAARGVRDLDTTLFSPPGDVLAQDIEPDAHPTVQVCSGDEPRRLYYALHAYAGAGSFVYASFVGGRDSFEVAHRVVGGRPGVVAEGEEAEGLEGRLQEVRAGVARRGFRPHGDPAPVRLAADQRVRLPLGAERGHCYTVVALPAEGVEDLDIRVLDELDRELASDTSPSAEASTQLCVDRDAALAAEVHAASGAGVAEVVFFEAAQSEAGGTSGLWLGQRADMRLASAPLADAARGTVDRMRGAGWGPPTRVAAGTLASGEAAEHRVRLRPARCTLLVATGGRGLGALHLRLVDDAGAVLAESRERVTGDAGAALRLCPDRPVDARAILVARRGTGAYSLDRLERTLPDALADAPATVRGALLDALDEASDGGWELSGGPRAVALDASGEATVRLEGDGCVRALGAASGGEVTVELRQGDRVAARSTGPGAWVLSCPPDEGPRPALRLGARPSSEVWLVTLRQR